MTPPLTLQTADVASALSSDRWWELPALRRLLAGQPATILGYDAGPDPASPAYAFLAADVTPAFAPTLRTVRRLFLQLGRNAVLALDIAHGKGPVDWRLDGKLPEGLRRRSLLPPPGQPDREERVFLNVLHSPTVTVEPISSVDLAGARLGSTVVLFHTGIGMANSSLFFDLAADGQLLFLVAGVSPGVWEVWRDGFLEENSHAVAPQKGVLRFVSEAGNFFLRQR
jgi:hypothetical protein